MERQITPSNVDSVLAAVLKPIKTIIEDAHKKEVEFMEWAGDYRANTLTYSYKFKGEPEKYSEAPKLFDNESSTFSEMQLDGLKKLLPVKKEVAFVLLFDMRKLNIARTVFYYINNNDQKSIYDSKTFGKKD